MPEFVYFCILAQIILFQLSKKIQKVSNDFYYFLFYFWTFLLTIESMNYLK